MEDNVWVAIFTNPVVVAGLISLVTSALGWLAFRLKSWFEARMGKEKLQTAITMAEVIASGVEQVAGKFGWDSNAKLDQAVSRLREWAKTHGITYTDDQWKMIVERTVLALTKTWSVLKDSASKPVEANAVHDSY
ncbi:MAG: hypothetical protein KA140_02815 [Caldisericia bacterium]|nr:hypothetical protein [Caldisericia bacterium]